MVIHSDIYAAEGNIQQQQLQPAQQLIDVIQQQPLSQGTVDFNNYNVNNIVSTVPAYENNINHLNNLFQIQESQTISANNVEGNVVGTVGNPPRTTTYIPHKGSMPRSSRSSSPTTKSCYTNDSVLIDNDYEAHLLDFLLMGDDFFLHMARMELRCKFKKSMLICFLYNFMFKRLTFWIFFPS